MYSIELAVKVFSRGPLEPLGKAIRVHMSRQVDTAAITERGLLVVNPDFYIGLDDEELMGVVAHEILHLARHHFRRAKAAGASGLRANVAADLEVNGLLRYLGYTLPQGCIMPEEVLPLEVWLKRDESRGEVERQEQEQGQSNDGQEGLEGDGKGSEGKSPMDGDLLPEPLQRKLEGEFERKTGQRLPSASEIGKMAGKVPGDTRLLVEAMRSTRGLADKLRRFLEEEFGIQVCLTWSKTPLEIFPRKRGEPRIGILLDASGSMEMLLPEAVKAAKEVYTSFAATSPLLASWDTRLVREYKSFPKSVECSLGGTAMDEGAAWMAKKGVSTVVVITDGYTPWRKEVLPKCRILVVVLLGRGELYRFPGEEITPTVYWEVRGG